MRDHRLSRRIAAVVCVLVPAPVFLTGCESLPAMRPSSAWQGQTPIRASYLWGTLEAELPPGTRMETALVAARAQLERQGHVVKDWSFTPQGGRLVALPPPDVSYNRVHVSGRTDTAGGAVLKIHINPHSEARTRKVLDAILVQLGV